jgi:serine/threonine-protein kinase
MESRLSESPIAADVNAVAGLASGGGADRIASDQMTADEITGDGTKAGLPATPLQGTTPSMEPVASNASSSTRDIPSVKSSNRLTESALIDNPLAPSMSPAIVRIVQPQLLGPQLPNESLSDSDVPLDSTGAALASSLIDALKIAKRYGITRIDIAVPVLITEPVRVDVDHLRITSSVGGGSVVVFQSGPRLSMERAEMFVIGDHPIEFNDLHFIWNVPSDELDGGTMFKLHDNRSIELTDCTITINNPSLREEVYAFDIVTDPDKRVPSKRLRLDRSTAVGLVTGNVPDSVGVQEVFPLVDMKLYNVIVRGQITMIHMDYAAKLWLDWDNGLVAVTDRMIDMAGARLPPPPGSGAIKMSMTRVTAHVPKGIVRTRLGVSGSHAVPIDRLARKSVFIVNAGSPHFEITGMPPQEVAAKWLQMEGSGNAYVVDPTLSDPLLQISTPDGQTETTRFSELSSMPPGWVDENRPRWSVKWAAARLPNSPAGNRRVADYRQTDAVSPPGFDEKSLPTLPVASAPLPETTSNGDPTGN